LLRLLKVVPEVANCTCPRPFWIKVQLKPTGRPEGIVTVIDEELFRVTILPLSVARTV
jgi:hypothetical protein